MELLNYQWVWYSNLDKDYLRLSNSNGPKSINHAALFMLQDFQYVMIRFFSVVIWGLTTYVIFCCWYQAKKHKYIFGELFFSTGNHKKIVDFENLMQSKCYLVNFNVTLCLWNLLSSSLIFFLDFGYHDDNQKNLQLKQKSLIKKGQLGRFNCS